MQFDQIPQWILRRACAAAACCLPMALLLSTAPAAGPYGEMPLRSNLSALPYCATEGGREGERFAAYEINHYRLYHFYARQAEYYLANPGDRSYLLPPFPELDGGRRGHWGVTNEKSTTAFVRPEGADFPAVMSRNGDAKLYISHGPGGGSGVIVYDTLQPRVETEIPDGASSVPLHPFEIGSDRFGFALKVNGAPRFVGPASEWIAQGKDVASYAGYYINGNDVVVRLNVADGVVLDQPLLRGEGGETILVRNMEFTTPVTAPLEFRLPGAGGQNKEGDSTPAAVRESGGDISIRWESAGRGTLHWIHSTAAQHCHTDANGARLVLEKTEKGTRLIVASWTGPAADADHAVASMSHAVKAASAAPPSSLTTGGPLRYPQTVSVAGVRNADPAASGSAYEIDDIPAPSVNPYRAAMTLSGIAFDSLGAAYVCTLTGDVWKVTGLDDSLRAVTWKRFAAGLDLPLGIAVVDDVPYVCARRNVLRLLDRKHDGEADCIEKVNRMDLPTKDECGHDLRTDATGNFYFNGAGGIFRLSKDGAELTRIGHGSRNPLGLGVRRDGLALSDSSEGNLGNGACSIFESDHEENAGSVAKLKRILCLPRGVDNSPGSRLFMEESRFGPLGSDIVGVSYGTGNWYYLLRNVAENTPQAALVPMPGSFSSGACRAAVNPRDGQVFVAGLDGWGDYAVTEGCLHRIRYTGRKQTLITGWDAYQNGIELRFNADLDAASVAKASFFLQQWNVVDSMKTYGSPEYSVAHPEEIGHDRLEITSVSVLPDRRALFIGAPALLPAMFTQIHGTLKDAEGKPVTVDLYATLNHLPADSKLAATSPAGKPSDLKVPEKESNGDTYQQIVEHFDKLAGRDPATRPVSAEIAFPKGHVTYRWLKENVVMTQCMPCHATGTQHDLTTYAGIMNKVNVHEPTNSRIFGMITTKSMPPYPLPSVAPSVQAAILDWIQSGAPE